MGRSAPLFVNGLPLNHPLSRQRPHSPPPLVAHRSELMSNHFSQEHYSTRLWNRKIRRRKNPRCRAQSIDTERNVSKTVPFNPASIAAFAIPSIP